MPQHVIKPFGLLQYSWCLPAQCWGTGHESEIR